MAVKIKCPDCKGTGMADMVEGKLQSWKKCSTCDGKGAISVAN